MNLPETEQEITVPESDSISMKMCLVPQTNPSLSNDPTRITVPNSTCDNVTTSELINTVTDEVGVLSNPDNETVIPTHSNLETPIQDINLNIESHLLIGGNNNKSASSINTAVGMIQPGIQTINPTPLMVSRKEEIKDFESIMENLKLPIKSLNSEFTQWFQDQCRGHCMPYYCRNKTSYGKTIYWKFQCKCGPDRIRGKGVKSGAISVNYNCESFVSFICTNGIITIKKHNWNHSHDMDTKFIRSLFKSFYPAETILEINRMTLQGYSAEEIRKKTGINFNTQVLYLLRRNTLRSHLALINNIAIENDVNVNVNVDNNNNDAKDTVNVVTPAQDINVTDPASTSTSTSNIICNTDPSLTIGLVTNDIKNDCKLNITSEMVNNNCVLTVNHIEQPQQCDNGIVGSHCLE